MKKKEIVILAGPTGVGKTALSLALAKAIGGEIVSADSIQVYRYLNIGSAKIGERERQGIPHHLLDIWSPLEDFDVVQFQKMTRDCLHGVWERGHVPILVGGTGFYIQSIIKGVEFTETDIPAALTAELEGLTTEELYARLQAVDPVYAQTVHMNNRKRVLRALSYSLATGEAFSAYNERESRRVSPYSYSYFVLTDEREQLYQRIDRRVDEMLAAGLVDEVRNLVQMGCHAGMTSMQGIGYKEVLTYLTGEIDYQTMAADIKQHTRHYAKRQLTWFKREPDVIWLSKQDYPDQTAILQTMISQIEKRRNDEREDVSGTGETTV